MPEGHTLHRIAGRLNDAFAGTVVQVSSPQGRFVEGAALLDSQPFEEAWAHGKLLFAQLGPHLLHVHLGLIGRFDVQRPTEPIGGGPARLRIENDRAHAELRGPMTCTLIDPVEYDALIERQGPDPIQADADSADAWQRITASRKSIAELLMDQSVIAGIGNVYRCELLFRHRVNPAFAGNRIKRATWQAMWSDLVRLMALGVRLGAIITVEEDVVALERALATGTPPTEIARTTYVYKHTGEACPRCGARIRARQVAGRTLYWCGGCQRRT